MSVDTTNSTRTVFRDIPKRSAMPAQTPAIHRPVRGRTSSGLGATRVAIVHLRDCELGDEPELRQYRDVVVVEGVDDQLPVPHQAVLHPCDRDMPAGGSQLVAVRQRQRRRVGALEGPLVAEGVALSDEAAHRVVDVRERAQLQGETLVDRAPPHEGAVRHVLHGVLRVEIQHPVEITCVVPGDVQVQEFPVGHRLLPFVGLGHTWFGTRRDSATRITLWPKSAVGPNINGQPPSITVMPCCRPYSVAGFETLLPPEPWCIQTCLMPSSAHSRLVPSANSGLVAITTASTPPGIEVRSL